MVSDGKGKKMTENRAETGRVWVLPRASDPEMEAIERLLRECGETVVYAKTAAGERVLPGQRAAVIHIGDADTVYTVECDPPLACGEPEDEPDAGQVTLNGRRYMAARCCVEVSVIRIDHHQLGDPGYGRPPSEFLAASSIGQVVAELARLGRLPGSWDQEGGPDGLGLGEFFFALDGDPSAAPDWFVVSAVHDDGSDDGGEPDFDSTDLARIPRDLVLIAAADHCLGSAYAGDCPGVDPEELLRWRAEGRAKFQKRHVDEVLSDMALAREAISRAPKLQLAGLLVVDLRNVYTVTTVLVEPFTKNANVDASGIGNSTSVEFGECTEGVWDEGSHHRFVRRGVRELPDIASREGVAYLAYVDTDGSGRACRPKIVLGGRTTPEMVRAFLDHWAPAQGLVEPYGVPERGFAGAYMPQQ